MLKSYDGFEKVGEQSYEHGPSKPWFKFHTPQTITNQFDERVVVDYFLISTVSHLDYDGTDHWETMIFPCDVHGEVPEGDYSGIYASVSSTPMSETEVLGSFISTIKE